MPDSSCREWVETMAETVDSYRRMVDATIDQLNDDELRARPDPQTNSVAVILRHLGGNLRSRWTDFLTTDGEKPDRHRDREFEDWEGDRASLMEYFDGGWRTFTSALRTIDDSNVQTPIHIRGERHTILQAVTRAVAHVAYHVGQIAIIARMVHQGEWQWLTIPPGQSAQFNSRTWGSSASRSILSDSDESGE